MNEMREWRRLDVNVSAKGRSLTPQGDEFACEVVNVNPDGLCFIAPESVKPGDELSLTMELPAIGATDVLLRIVWAGFFDQSKTYRVGGKFENVDGCEKNKFMRFYHLKMMSSLGG